MFVADGGHLLEELYLLHPNQMLEGYKGATCTRYEVQKQQ